jgi:hypothetical protein
MDQNKQKELTNFLERIGYEVRGQIAAAINELMSLAMPHHYEFMFVGTPREPVLNALFYSEKTKTAVVVIVNDKSFTCIKGNLAWPLRLQFGLGDLCVANFTGIFNGSSPTQYDRDDIFAMCIDMKEHMSTDRETVAFVNRAGRNQRRTDQQVSAN